jgi:hypothetical protein
MSVEAPPHVPSPDHDAAYWRNDDGSGPDQVRERAYMEDYWGSGSVAPAPVAMSDEVPWTIQTAEATADGDTAGADVIPAREDVNQNPPGAEAGLIYPSHIPPGPAEVGYGKWGAPAPFIGSHQQMLDQAIVLTVAERLVADQRAILVQHKVAENAHMETFPFANGAIVGSSPPVQIGTRHANGAGYLLLASAAGLYVGTDQSVGTGNMGIPIQTGTTFMHLPINANLYISSANVALGQATSLYLIQLIMGSTTLSGDDTDLRVRGSG